jgi:hypothetical protein
MQAIYEIFLNQMITMMGYRLLILLASPSPGFKKCWLFMKDSRNHTLESKSQTTKQMIGFHTYPELIQVMFFSPEISIPVFSKNTHTPRQQQRKTGTESIPTE